MMFRETTRANKPTVPINNQKIVFDYVETNQDHQKENNISHIPFRGREMHTRGNVRQ